MQHAATAKNCNQLTLRVNPELDMQMSLVGGPGLSVTTFLPLNLALLEVAAKRLIKKEKKDVCNFKVGDKVRCVNPPTSCYIFGKIYTVTSFSPSGEFVRVDGELSGNYLDRYELVKEEFNISTATDQELADKYRRLLKEREPIYKELSRRGYMVYGDDTISKTETIKL